MKKSRILTFLIAFSSLSMASCVYNNGIPMEVKSEIKIELDTKEIELKVNDGGKTFIATLSSEEVEIKNEKLIVKVSDSSIISVDADKVDSGKQVRVKGKKVGKAEVTVTSVQDPKAKAKVKVEVVESGPSVIEVESLNVETNTLDLIVGETKQLVERGSDSEETIYYEVLPADATNKSVIFSKDTSESFTISEDGLITATKKGSGKAVITTQSKGLKQEITVNVAEDETLTENAVYLVGSSAALGNWTKIIKAMEFKDNPNNPDEYMITFEGKKDDEFKAKRYTNPDKSENWLGIDFNQISDLAVRSGDNLKLVKDGRFTVYLTKNPVKGNLYKYWVSMGS